MFVLKLSSIESTFKALTMIEDRAQYVLLDSVEKQ